MTQVLDTPEPASTGTSTGSRLVDRHLERGRRLHPLIAPTGRTVVVVPHPDDEALAVGGLIAHQRARGRDVVVVAVTDGDAAYPDWDGADLAGLRRREQVESLEVLGVHENSIRRLGVDDGTASHRVAEIADDVFEVVSAGDTLVAPASFDWHPDHEACGRAAAVVAARVGCTLLGSLFWAHHHPERMPSALSLGALALSDDEVARRRRAVEAHRSQLERSSHTTIDPILNESVLGLLDVPVEHYVLGRPSWAARGAPS